MRAPFLMLIVFAAALGLLASSCTGRGPSAPAPPDPVLVNLFADRMIVREEASLGQADSTTLNARLDSLYRAYHIPPEELERRLEEYRRDLDTWKRFYDQVAARLDQIQAGQVKPLGREMNGKPETGR